MNTVKAILLIPCLCAAAAAQPYEGPDTLWTRILHREVVGDARCEDMVFYSDGCMVVSGQQMDAEEHPGEDLFLMKLDSMGGMVWRSVYGDSTAGIWWGGFMCQPRSDRYVMVATRWDDCDDLYLAVSNDEGNILRQQPYRWVYDQCAQAICPVGDDGCLIVYKTINQYTSEESACWMKVTADGDSIWARNVTFPGNRVWVRTADSTNDGGAVIGGYLGPPGAPVDALLIKLDAAGMVEFTRTYDLTDEEYVGNILVLQDGGYLLSGSTLETDSVTNPIQPYALRVDAVGDSMWVWIMESPQGGCGRVSKAIAALGGGTTLGCETSEESRLVRLDSMGEELWNRTYELPEPNCLGIGKCVAQDSLGHYVMVGQSRNLGSPQDDGIAIVKTQPDPVLAGVGDSRAFLPNTYELTVFPNPFNNTTQIEFFLPVTQRVSLRLYDVLGREVATLVDENRTAGEHDVQWDASAFPSGVYLVRLSAGTATATKKVVLLK